MLAHIPPDVITRDADPTAIAVRALVAVGSTHRQIAAALTAAGFTGLLEDAHACPLSRYLLATDSRLISAAVDGNAVYLVAPGKYAEVDLPEAVRSFVVRFDIGHYPDLIAEPLPSHVADPGTTTASEDYR